LVLYAVGLAFALAAFAVVFVKSLWVGLLLTAALLVAMLSFTGVLYVRIRRSRRSEPVAEGPQPQDPEARHRVPGGRSLASQGSQLQSR